MAYDLGAGAFVNERFTAAVISAASFGFSDPACSGVSVFAATA